MESSRRAERPARRRLFLLMIENVPSIGTFLDRKPVSRRAPTMDMPMDDFRKAKVSRRELLAGTVATLH